MMFGQGGVGCPYTTRTAADSSISIIKNTAILEQDTDWWIRYKKLTLTGAVKTRRSSCLDERLLLSCGHVLYMKIPTEQKTVLCKRSPPPNVSDQIATYINMVTHGDIRCAASPCHCPHQILFLACFFL